MKENYKPKKIMTYIFIHKEPGKSMILHTEEFCNWLTMSDFSKKFSFINQSGN